MYLEKHNTVFVHIPKCAGTSIENTLKAVSSSYDYTDNELLLVKNKNPLLGPPSLHHLSAREYLNRKHLSSEQWSKAYKFSLVRNPYSRLVSAYNYRGLSIRARILGKKSWTFEEFVLKFFPKFFDENYIYGHDNWTHVKPMWHFTHDKSASYCLLDKLVKLENLQVDLLAVQKEIHLPIFDDLQHTNKSSIRDPLSGNVLSDSKVKFHWSDYYTPKTKEFVKIFYSKDFEIFDYSMDW